MTSLRERLDAWGLSSYLDDLVSEGFDTWETILDITESDLNALGFKLGHRRKLQRAIAETRSQFPDRILPLYTGKPSGGGEGGYRSDDSNDHKSVKRGDGSNTGAATSTKRKYRRHPKADENAPERPPSAYVIFSNQMREELKGQELTFTEIAKVVGERWQILSPDSREGYEREANAAKEKYYAGLAEYKKTEDYTKYQDYLKDFKSKHDGSNKNDGKRSKVESETSNASSSTQVPAEPAHRTRASTNNIDPAISSHCRSGSSPPHSYARHPAGAPPHMNNTNASSPGSYFPPHLNSPTTSASPHSKDAHVRPSTLQSLPSTSSGTPPSTGPSYRDLPRRTYRDSPSLPSLTHEETTISSDGGSIVSMPSYGNTNFLPTLDANKAQRTLPPVSTLAPTANGPYPPMVTQSPNLRPGASSIEALLRADEISRAGDQARQSNSH